MTDSIAVLIAKRFIQRRDVKAVQLDHDLNAQIHRGDWMPDHKFRDPSVHGLGFKMSHLNDHLLGTHTYGHYLIDNDNRCRVFALDIDLEESGSYVQIPANLAEVQDDIDFIEKSTVFVAGHEGLKCGQGGPPCPRELWLDRNQVVARLWYKYQMKMLASKLAGVIRKDLELPCAVAYSGSKGVHVYGFLPEEKRDASEAHEAALLTLDLSNEFAPSRGKVFFKHKNQDPLEGYPSFSVEIFPKQGSIEGKTHGNLMRLPLGRNLKSSDPTFFLTMTGPMSEFTPHPDPVFLLDQGDPFREPWE